MKVGWYYVPDGFELGSYNCEVCVFGVVFEYVWIVVECDVESSGLE